MKKYARKNIYTIVFLLCTLLFISVLTNSIPVRRSEEAIRQIVFEKIPIGTKLNKAIKIINNDTNWEIQSICESRGYSIDRDGLPSARKASNEESTVGDKFIEIYFGGYKTFFSTDVSVFIAFDEKSNLVDIAVRKDVDAL